MPRHAKRGSSQERSDSRVTPGNPCRGRCRFQHAMRGGEAARATTPKRYATRPAVVTPGFSWSCIPLSRRHDCGQGCRIARLASALLSDPVYDINVDFLPQPLLQALVDGKQFENPGPHAVGLAMERA
jgi:hypothetical protein